MIYIPLIYALSIQIFLVPTPLVQVLSIPTKAIFKIVTPEKVVTPKEVLSNTRIFNSYFVNEIKDLCIDKIYEKNQVVV